MVVLRSAIERFLGVGHSVYHVALLAQAGVEMVAQQRLVFHNQQFHGLFPLSIRRPGNCPACC
ncbi:hypothetical protein D3C77_779040 [compost metagenome]